MPSIKLPQVYVQSLQVGIPNRLVLCMIEAIHIAGKSPQRDYNVQWSNLSKCNLPVEVVTDVTMAFRIDTYTMF